MLVQFLYFQAKVVGKIGITNFSYQCAKVSAHWYEKYCVSVVLGTANVIDLDIHNHFGGKL